jgi:SAM-dependent methyltransferase
MRDPRRAANEISHGTVLAQGDPEEIWGWGTPAGRLRAQRLAALIAAGAQLGLGVRVLEIGCGTGMFTEMFLEYGATLVAVDISAKLLAKARARNLPASKVKFLETRFEDCGVEGPFDAVIGSSVLHHLDIGLALRRIHDLLKPGGFMCFAEPNMLNPQVFVERKFSFLRRWFWYVSPDGTAFLRGPLRNLLSTAGFAEIEIYPFDWLQPATPSHLIKGVQKLGVFVERTPILRELSGSLLIRARRPLKAF